MTADQKHPLLEFERLVMSIRIDHVAYAHALERLELCYDSVGKEPNAVCLHIAGESRTGKSSVLKDFLSMHPVSRDVEGRRQSIVYTRLPARATVKALVEALLLAFGDPAWNRGSTTTQTARLLEYLSKTGCRMIILDEFQHLCNAGQNKQLDETSNWLKNLVEDQQWALVAAGLPESTSVINRNKQFHFRFDPTVTLPLFNWRDAGLQKQYRAIIRAFVNQLSPFELPDLSSEEMSLRTFLATSGRVGLLAKLLSRAVKDAIRKGTTKIRLEDLALAFESAIWFAPKFPIARGPFLGNLTSNQAELVNHIVALATSPEAYDEGGALVHLHGIDPADVVLHPKNMSPKGRQGSHRKQSAELSRALACSS